MNILSIMRAATLGNIKRLRPMILWTVLEYMLRGAPYGILLGVVWELFKPLQNPGADLNVRALIGLSVAMAIALVLLFIVSKKAYLEVYSQTYNLCADGRLEIGDHLRKLSMGFFNARDQCRIHAQSPCVANVRCRSHAMFAAYLPGLSKLAVGAGIGTRHSSGDLV
jgi:ATP-binding cassette subfamily B protein IrtB